MTEKGMIVLLQRRVEKAGGIRAAARELKISAGYLNDVLKGNRRISPATALKLGFKREDRLSVIFRPILKESE